MGVKIIVSSSINKNAYNKLKQYGKVLLFESKAMTYPAISNHPDIFFSLVDDKLIIAPNTPVEFQKVLLDNNVNYRFGDKDVGERYPSTACYNSVVTDNYLIHKIIVTDKKVLNSCVTKKIINVKQAYTRCNLLPLPNNKFITSDKGIYKALNNINLDVLYVNPVGILLPDFDYGFFGGACGFFNNTLFISGSLNNFDDGNRVIMYLKKAGVDVVELHDGPLVDLGSILFLV